MENDDSRCLLKQTGIEQSELNMGGTWKTKKHVKYPTPRNPLWLVYTLPATPEPKKYNQRAQSLMRVNTSKENCISGKFQVKYILYIHICI